ncbi:MAG TPA: GNAT family N-acetyltransferase [Candidatus Binataceae bacterium]|nr:GNAT family N-acetyltransferase [Candidatus Binataceae bacterium]
MESPRVSVLFSDQFDEAAAMLARAFVDDPLMWALLPEVRELSERVRRITTMFETILALEGRDAQPVLGVMIDGKVAAAAIIEGAQHESLTGVLIDGIRRGPGMIRALGWGGTLRSVEVLRTLAQNHPPEPHIYLNFLGVDPNYQRHHLGTALVSHLRELVTERANLCGVYLENSVPANVPYYQARGYQITGEIFPLGVRMWQMMQYRPA